jgi:hypothetical protein
MRQTSKEPALKRSQQAEIPNPCDFWVVSDRACCIRTGATYAQTFGSPLEGGRSQWRAMRQEMMAACANQSAGTSCSYSREGQTVGGTCQWTRRGQLVCRTGEGGRGREMRGPMGNGMPEGNAPEQ